MLSLVLLCAIALFNNGQGPHFSSKPIQHPSKNLILGTSKAEAERILGEQPIAEWVTFRGKDNLIENSAYYAKAKVTIHYCQCNKILSVESGENPSALFYNSIKEK